MVEYEWEPGRIPRSPRLGIVGSYPSRARAIAEYVALEFPRESVTWVLSPGPSIEAKGRFPK